MTTEQFLRLADKLAIVFAIIFVGFIALNAMRADGVVLGERGVVGGDFLAFYTAGEFAAAGDALSAYDQSQFDAKLKERAPLDQIGMMWQYPPTAFFLTAALTVAPYKASYLLWMALTWAALAAALHSMGVRGRALRLLVLSPFCLLVVMLGQISLLTGAMLALAAYKPKSRWIVAGLAAGLLTVKPQLGLLLPIAYVAVGAWRTIAVAAVTALIIHTPSLLVFGIEGWREFLTAVQRLNTDVVGSGVNTPAANMTTLFSQLRLLGVPSSIAAPVQYVAALLIAIATWRVWRMDVKGIDNNDMALAKCAVLCAGAILASPYAYIYEMAALLPAGLYLARRAEGWTTPLGVCLIAAWAAIANQHLIPDAPLQLPFLVSGAAFILCVALAHNFQITRRMTANSQNAASAS